MANHRSMCVAHHFAALLIFCCCSSAPFLTHNFLFQFLVFQTILFHGAIMREIVPFRCCLYNGNEQKKSRVLRYIIKVSSLWADGCRKSERKEITIFLFYFSVITKGKLKEESKSLKLFLMLFVKLFVLDRKKK